MTRTNETKNQQLFVPGIDVQDTVKQPVCVLLVVNAHSNPLPLLLEGLVRALKGRLPPVSKAMVGVAELLLPKDNQCNIRS